MRETLLIAVILLSRGFNVLRVCIVMVSGCSSHVSIYEGK